MNHIVKIFLVSINNRNAFVLVHSYPNNAYIIRFLNDSYSDFINSYKAFGFGVIAKPGEEIKFELKGSIPLQTAIEIWENIETKLDCPDHELIIEGFEKE
jgi:hypothetical protein